MTPDNGQKQETQGPVHDGLRKWVAEHLLLGYSAEGLTASMLQHGISLATATEAIHDALHSPYFQAARDIAWQRKKLSNLLLALGEIHKLNKLPQKPLKRRLTPQEFYEQYFFLNRPIVVQGILDDWPALREWSPDNFRRRFGHLEVEVNVGRESDPDNENHIHINQTMMTFADYIDRISIGRSNDMYIVAKNHLLLRREFGALLDEISAPAGFLDATRMFTKGNVKLWFGPAGTITPLHHDTSNVFLAQIYGRKAVQLIAPYFTGALHNRATYFASVDPVDPDLGKFPEFRDVEVIDVVLDPGEVLLIPIGWWHWVQALEVSMSLSLHNFLHDLPSTVWKTS